MKIWAITYGDGYEFSGVIVEEFELNVRNEKLET